MTKTVFLQPSKVHLFFNGRPAKRASDTSPRRKHMDIKQLQLLAERVREFLQDSGHPIGHSQSLDVIAALPGLRNWPEVKSFPDRVSACELDGVSAARLAFRLKNKFDIDFFPPSLLTALSPTESDKLGPPPEIWPTGPIPGVYVTTSQDAINALLAIYEDATDGALVYAERAGNHCEGAIDLGDYGLWSAGLSRVPSGTLLVVGPIELNQQSWDESAATLGMACKHALYSEHRVAVLVSTPSPEAVFEDIRLMVRSVQEEEDDLDSALLGTVAENGELQRRVPFAKPRPQLERIANVAAVDAIPPAARATLQEALAKRTSGLLMFGSEVFDEHPGIELVAASLALTEHAGPAARIMPRQRGTPAKDWQVPEPIKRLPFLPSIESAYDQGYRRMVFTPGYADAEVLLKFGRDSLLIAGTYGFDVSSVFMRLQLGGILEGSDLLKLVIALLGVMPIPTKHGVREAIDLFVMPTGAAIEPMKYEDILHFLETNRILRWQDEMTYLLESGAVTVAGIKKVAPRNHKVKEFLQVRCSQKKATSGAR
jgi:hypothetical protein